jgi:hypothetical protein
MGGMKGLNSETRATELYDMPTVSLDHMYALVAVDGEKKQGNAAVLKTTVLP